MPLNRRASDRRGLSIALTALLAANSPCAAPAPADAVRADAERLASYPTRVPGTPTHAQAVDGVIAAVRALPGVRVWVHEFRTVVPVTDEAFIEIPEGPHAGRHRVYPFWPAAARLNTTPDAGIAGELVPVGEGRMDQIPARRVRGRIAVMDMAGGGRWKDVFAAGASAVVLLGSDAVTQYEAHTHLLRLPAWLPRFYVPPGALADALRQGIPGVARIVSRAAWQERAMRNVYALVLPPGGANPPAKAIALAAPLDSAGVVPEQAPGADAAVDAALLLDLLRRFSDAPPARPVLCAFLDACSINQLGVRRMLAALATLPSDRARFLEEDVERLSEYAAVEAQAAELGAGDRAMESLHRRGLRDLARCVKDEVARDSVTIEDDLARLRTRVHKAPSGEREPIEREIRTLAAARARLNAVQVALLTDRPLSPELAPLARQVWDRTRRRVTEQKKEQEAVLARHADEDRLRTELLQALGLPAEGDVVPLAFLFSADLSDAGIAAGPSLLCHHLYWSDAANAEDLRTWLTGVAERESAALWPAPTGRAVNLRPFTSMDSVASYTVGPTANLTSPAASFRLPAMSWATLDGFRARVDTPNDRADRLDWDRLTPQVAATRALIERLCREDDFQPREPLGRSDRWRGVRGAIVERSAGDPVPRLPMQGYLTALLNGHTEPGRGVLYYRPVAAGVRAEEFCFTGTDGRFRFEALPGRVGNGPNGGLQWALRRVFVQSWLLNPDGGIARAVDMNRVGKGVRLEADILDDTQPLRAVVFTCDQVSQTGLTDARFLTPFWPTSSSLLDAVRGGRPQRMNVAMYDDVLCGLLEPGSRWLMVLRMGATQNRMALLNLDPEVEDAGATLRRAMRGFALNQPLPSTPVHVAARDIHELNGRRLEGYARAGIRSEAIEQMRRAAGAMLDEADDAVRRDDSAGLYRSSMGAMAAEIRAYQAVRELASDVVLAAIFLLLALVPFSFAFERLVFACSHVYRQLAAALAIFAVMTAILWSFHPAFRISNQPLIIIMAFGILFMSLMVMSVCYAKFKSGLDEMRSGKAETSAARASGAGVLMSAVILGLANMRKRPLRTALTGITVMLITFAILCFSSVSTYVDRKEFDLNVRGSATGVLVRMPSSRPLPAETLPYLASLFGEDALVPQYWWTDPADRQWRIHIQNPRTGRAIAMKAALGLAPGEAAMSGVHRVLPDWDAFAAGDGCYLAASAAAELGARRGDEVLVAGHALRLIGTFDDSAPASGVRSLDGLPILPYDYSALDEEQRRNLVSTDFNVLSAHLESSDSMEPGVHVPTLEGRETVIVHARRLVTLGRGASLRAVAMPAASFDEARQRALDVARRIAVPVYFGSPERVGVVSAIPLRPTPPKGLLLPILIAGLIIFNTMLSSIAERRREIHVYTSLGLAPVHVGALFVAEALTYGLMGSIFGYIVGQGAATVLSRMNWLAGITLNYSGTQAVMTMGLVQVIVVLSAIVPALVAARIASPSHEMTWSVPQPEGDVIRDMLPFTVTRAAARGVLGFLYQYVDAHREGSIGHFTTDHLRVEREEADGTLSLRATVWLAPYDLGVRQEARLRIRPTAAQDVCEIDVELRRGTGQTHTWWKLNRVFLADLRRQLLGWRKLKTDRVLAYIAEGRELAAAVPPAAG